MILMDSAVSPTPGYRFGMFELDRRARELRKKGRRIRLQEHPFKILTLLLEHAGEIVTREELRNTLWGDGTVVDFDNGLNAVMGKLRQALRDSAENPRYIETIPRLGYRFIATVETCQAPVAPAEPELESPPPPPRTTRLLWRTAIGLAFSIVVVATAYVVAGLVHWRPAGTVPRPVIAVLPFQDLDRDAGAPYLGDGLTEEMTAQLSRMEPQNLGVIARTSAMLYRNSMKSAAQIGQELGVDYLLEGSLRRSEDRVRVTVQLIRTRDQVHIWAETYDSNLGDVLTLEAEVARAVADRISVALSRQTRARLGAVKAVNPKAYEAFLRGRYFLWSEGMNSSSAETAVSYLRQAVQEDGSFAPAYAALGEYFSLAPQISHARLQEDLGLARLYSAKALQLDSTLAEAHMSMAWVALMERDWSNARREFARTLQLDPSLVRARALYAVYLLAVGQPEDAVREIRQAQQMDPLSQSLRSHVPRTLYFAHRYEEAIEECRKVLELKPDSRFIAVLLAMSNAELGHYAKATEILGKIRPAEDDTGTLAEQGYVYARSGHPEEARKILNALQQSADQDFTAAYQLAVICAGLDEKQQAVAWLEKSFELRDPMLNNRLKLDPKLNSLRSEPRFRDLIRSMNYPR